MAVNETRNMGAELRTGISDGTVKKTAPNRGGPGADEYAFQKSIQYLSTDFYGYDFADVASGNSESRLTEVAD
jgi:hypothetical protein